MRGAEGATRTTSWEQALPQERSCYNQVVSWCIARILPESVTVSMGNLRDSLPISPKMGVLRNVVDHRWDKTEFVTSPVYVYFFRSMASILKFYFRE